MMLTRIHPQKTFLGLQRRTLFTRRATPTPTPFRTAVLASALLVSGGLFAVYYYDSRSAIHRWLVTPLLRYTLDAEIAHKVAVKVLRSGLGPHDVVEDDKRLKAELWGQELSNPIGLAAGFDKNGEAIDGLFNLGFCWVEIGSITPKPQSGNPRPRVFPLPSDNALINRYGFPSEGGPAVLARLRARDPSHPRPDKMLAVSLGKNTSSPHDSIDDFLKGVKMFGPYADVLVFNISSPNTPGLRGLQTKDLLEGLLSGIVEARDRLPIPKKPKLVLKIAPDMDETALRDVAEAVKRSSIDAVIVSNTTITRPDSLTHPNKTEKGGLSGPPLMPLTLRALRTLRTNLPASVPIIGCGGISTGRDALEFAKAGASMVQIYTKFGYDGVGACRRMKDELLEELEKEGMTWNEVVRKAVRKLSATAAEVDTVDGSGLGGMRRGSSTAVSQLIEEALELKTRLDELGERMFPQQAPAQNELHQELTPSAPPVPSYQ